MSKKVAMAGMFTALAMIFSYVEVLIPINLGILWLLLPSIRWELQWLLQFL